MKITFAGCSFASKYQCGFIFIFQHISQRNSIGQCHLRAKVRDHSDNIILLCSKMERTVAAFGKAIHFSLPLSNQPVQRNFTTGKYTKVAVHWQYIFVLIQCHCSSNSNSFLSDPGEPFAYFTLTKKNQHFFFDHSWSYKIFIKVD
ncbi:hypothetical protein D3C80_1041260 [compost metagenome]